MIIFLIHKFHQSRDAMEEGKMIDAKSKYLWMNVWTLREKNVKHLWGAESTFDMWTKVVNVSQQRDLFRCITARHWLYNAKERNRELLIAHLTSIGTVMLIWKQWIFPFQTRSFVWPFYTDFTASWTRINCYRCNCRRWQADQGVGQKPDIKERATHEQMYCKIHRKYCYFTQH